MKHFRLHSIFIGVFMLQLVSVDVHMRTWKWGLVLHVVYITVLCVRESCKGTIMTFSDTIFPSGRMNASCRNGKNGEFNSCIFFYFPFRYFSLLQADRRQLSFQRNGKETQFCTASFCSFLSKMCKSAILSQNIYVRKLLPLDTIIS